MDERHRRMLDLLAGIGEKTKQRDELALKLEYAIVHEIQKDMDAGTAVTRNGEEYVFTLTMDKYEELKKLHAKAVKNEEETFKFRGRVMLTAYAHHVLEFMAKTFEKHGGKR